MSHEASKRILFVDDDADILGGLRVVLRKKRAAWDMVFADSGETALGHLRSRPFDVVVSDMRMPKMDGPELLRRVKEEFPAIIRIVLSGHADRESVFRALPVSHQFLAKPCDGDTLAAVVERACSLHALLESEPLRRVVGSTERLPSLPQVYWELTQTMADPEVTPKAIAEIVEQDPAISAKLLQLVNSSYFCLARRISSVEQAIVYLGFDLLRALALTSQVFCAVDKIPGASNNFYTALQEHGFLTAAVARKMAPNAKAADDAFTAGLLHDIGKLVLTIAVPDFEPRGGSGADASKEPQYLEELAVLGVTHAEVGAYLLGLWGLPVPIVEAVAYHHTPQMVPPRGLDTVAIVHIADSLVSCLCPSPVDGPSGGVDGSYIEAIGATAEEVERWSKLASEIVAQRETKRGNA
jgi:HD-like signal output (HDOD) protein/CheY-like chemotaxis protein